MVLGCIADDFTGASDAASFLVKGGMNTILFNGIPESDPDTLLEDADAVVIALKTRTQETLSAVKDSLNAVAWLKSHGATRFYIKYCSTFDSTPSGNIGPVVDAAVEYLNIPYTILCPSLPINGRTVKEGVLYVNGVPLSESHMKNHPLTPMRESNIAAIMRPQSKYSSFILERNKLMQKEKLTHEISLIEKQAKHFYLIPDYETDSDASLIIKRFGGLCCLTGGSGLLDTWASHILTNTSHRKKVTGRTSGRGILLAGSCSKATLSQIEWFKNKGGISYKLNPGDILEGRQRLEDIEKFIMDHFDKNILIYSSEIPDHLDSIRGETLAEYAAVLENMMASIAIMVRDKNFTRIIVAGGETSGAVTKALGYNGYRIGPSICPGVPIMIPCQEPELRLVLKSGNFGSEDFFEKALALTNKDE